MIRTKINMSPASRSYPALGARLGVLALAAALVARASLPDALAADLTVADGVVVKFGADAKLVVRDKVSAGKSVVLTSRRDDTAGGQAGLQAQSAAPGDWRGVQIERTTGAYGAAPINDWRLRYAGAMDGGVPSAALQLRGVSPSLQYLQFSDNVVGLRLLDGANPVVDGASFTRNATGAEVSGSTPTFRQSQFANNTGFGIDNKTPAQGVTATGNWWGHSSGPYDAQGNPQGQGNPVTAGVNYGGFLATAPMLNPRVRLAEPATYFNQHDVLLDVSCVNAIEYRVAEAGAFSGVAFKPLPNEQAQVMFSLSEGDGRKSIDVEFRNAAGQVVRATLSGGVLVDTAAPVVVLNNPASGSVISGPVKLDASASDSSGIAQVSFYLNGTLVATRAASPYTYDWDTQASTDGDYAIRVIATDGVGRTGQHDALVTLSREPLAPDVEGPKLDSVAFDGTLLADGMSLVRDGLLTFAALDRSGIARVDLLIDGQVVGAATAGTSYSVLLDLDAVADGLHTLVLRGTDSLGNVSTTSFSITVAHAAPAAPVIAQPAAGLVTRTAALTVSGTAAAGASVQMVLNGQPHGAPVLAGADSRFSAGVELQAGANQIQATATDKYGTSALSAALTVTLDLTVPASPGELGALAQPGGKVRLSWIRSTDANVAAYHVYRSATPFTLIGEALRIATLPASAAIYEDMPPSDANWTYRVVSVNAAGTASVPTNAASATSDATLPVARSITYVSTGKTDPATGRFGQGRINLTLVTSEALQLSPYLAIVPEGGIPIPVDLVRTDATTYTGSFLVTASTAPGVANALFSARDAVGNRGTEVQAGATIRLDTKGPSLSTITLVPGAPIKNDTAQTIAATLVFDEAPAATPQVKYLLSGALRSAVPVDGLVKVDATTWTASFTLPSDAGLAAPETLSVSHVSTDDMDNASTAVSAFNRFQVYLGDLPPLDAPFGFTAKAQPGGKVRLAWQGVEEASSYQLYRQGPGDATLQPLVRASGTEYIDQTPADGTYKYAVATVRQVNGQESVSGQTAPAEVFASATAPGAPQELTLALTGQGIYAAWQAPIASTVDYYNLYRAGGSSITSIEGLTPIKTRIKTTAVYDTSPSPTQGAYVVTAVDAAGNESAISNSAYLNASLLPVRNLRVEQSGHQLPVISWTAPNGNVAGYLVYVGPESSLTKLTPTPISATSFTDTGFTSGERRYTVASVDANGVEMPRSVLLPGVSAQVVSGLPVKRGVMNKLQVQLANTSATALAGVRALVRLPINKEATEFKEHRSLPVTLGANQTMLVPVIVGGYAGIPGAPVAQVGVEVAPVDGELVKITRDETFDVSEGALVVGMATDEFTRGGTGKLRLTVENTSEVDVELLTATATGSEPSTEMRFKIIDADGNVLAAQPYRQVFGASVVTLNNGMTVARIPAGSSYVSDVFDVNVPGASPNSVRVKLEVDKLRYHTGQEDEVLIEGRGSERTVSLVDTAYYGEVTDVAPLSSFGDEPVIVNGRAIDRATGYPLPNTKLKLVLNQQGFERTFAVLTDSTGLFRYEFVPTLSDAGLYKVSAVHPDITDRPEQKAFTIHRVTVGPTPYKLDVPKNYPFTVPFTAKAGVGTKATNLRLVLDPMSQPTGVVPAGILVQLPSPVTLAERQTLNVPVVFTANNEAQPSGTLIFDVMTDEHSSAIGKVSLEYRLSDAKPYLVSSPAYVETGIVQGGSQLESITIKNSGLQDALNLRFTLTTPDGGAAPGWASIGSQADGTLAVGETRAVDLSFAPPSGVMPGVYEFRLNVAGDNINAQWFNVYVSLTQSGQGGILFKASDIYTATVGEDGALIAGLSGATVTVQNEDVPTISHELKTDSLGEALFQDLPAGSYKFRVTAPNHQEKGGRLLVKPGITANQPVFLDYNLVTVEWSVREITIQDRYEVTINATFETDVPAAVMVMQPSSINLPKMAAGDVYYGELSLTNYGLIRADGVSQQLPKDDAYFRFEFLAEVPASLEAKQRITLPYRVVALQSLDEVTNTATASGGGCYSYSNPTEVSGKYKCANGTVSESRTASTFVSSSTSTCSSGGLTPGGAGGGAEGVNNGWTGTIPASSAPTEIKTGKKCVFVPRGGTQQCQ